MMVEKLIFKIPRIVTPSVEPDDFDVILGSKYFLDFNPNIPSSMVTTGSGTVRIDSIQSVGLDTSIFSASGTARPELVSNAIGTKPTMLFDGVSNFMQIGSSSGLVNFLHNSQGTVIIVYKQTALNTNSLQTIIANTSGSTAQRGFTIFNEDRNSQSANNELRSYVTNGSAGQIVCQSRYNNILTPMQYNSIVQQFDPTNGVALDRIITNVNLGASYQDNVSTAVATGLNAGGNLTIGRAASASVYFASMEIARIIIADTILTSTQLTDINTRLAYEYGTFPIL